MCFSSSSLTAIVFSLIPPTGKTLPKKLDIMKVVKLYNEKFPENQCSGLIENLQWAINTKNS